MYEIHPQPPAAPAPPKPPTPPQPPAAPQVDKLTKLVGELLAAKKTDAEMLEAVTLATVGRLPTDTEKKLTLSLVATVTDRKAAWVAVAKSLTGSNDKRETGRGFYADHGDAGSGIEDRSTRQAVMS